jgi:hypothetical protein
MDDMWRGRQPRPGSLSLAADNSPQCIEPAHWLDDGARQIIGASSGVGCHEMAGLDPSHVSWLAGFDRIWAASIHDDAAGRVSS